MGIHSLDPSGWMVGLLREGRASKCSWTRVAIRDASVAFRDSILLREIVVECVPSQFDIPNVFSYHVISPISPDFFLPVNFLLRIHSFLATNQRINRETWLEPTQTVTSFSRVITAKTIQNGRQTPYHAKPGGYASPLRRYRPRRHHQVRLGLQHRPRQLRLIYWTPSAFVVYVGGNGRAEGESARCDDSEDGSGGWESAGGESVASYLLRLLGMELSC